MGTKEHVFPHHKLSLSSFPALYESKKEKHAITSFPIQKMTKRVGYTKSPHTHLLSHATLKTRMCVCATIDGELR